MDVNENIVPIMELGWFSWDLTNRGDKKKNLDLEASLNWEHILTRVDVNEVPNSIADLDELNHSLSTKQDF